MTRYLRLTVTMEGARQGDWYLERAVDDFAQRVEQEFGAPTVIVVVSPAPVGGEGFLPNDLVAVEAFADFARDQDWRRMLQGAARRVVRRLGMST